jgi:hypothetical protein
MSPKPQPPCLTSGVSRGPEIKGAAPERPSPAIPVSRPGKTLTRPQCAFRAHHATKPIVCSWPYRGRDMLSDPAAAAWVAAGRPAVDAPPPVEGRCGRCGADGPTVTSSRIISEKFTGYDRWPYGFRRLCVACAWAYSRQPTTQPAMLITTTTTTTVTEYLNNADLAAALGAALPHTHAVVLPVARRRHILPTADWGHLATDGLVIRWDTTAAGRLTDLGWLRNTVGASWPQLGRAAPPAQLLSNQPRSRWPKILAIWPQLQQWRTLPALWAAAQTLTYTKPGK